MFSNIVPSYVTSLVPSDSVYKHTAKNSSVYIYHTFQSIFGRICVHCNMMRKQEIPWLEENSVTLENNDSTPQKSTTTNPENVLFECLDNEKQQLLSDKKSESLCEISVVQDITSDDCMVINSNDIDFLLKCSDSHNNLRNIDKVKKSLYVKFDPLYAKSITNLDKENVMFIHSTDFDVGYETGSTESSTDQPFTTMSSPNITLYNFKEKPTQVVPPVIKENSITCTHNHTPVLMRSVSTLVSPRCIPVASLINAERNSSPQTTQSSLEHQQIDYNICNIDVYQLQTTKNVLQKQECELHHLRKENKHLKSMLQSLEKKKKSAYEDLASNIKVVSDENKKLLERQNQLLQNVKEKAYNNKQLSLVMEEYENTILTLINEQQKMISKMHERQRELQSDRDQTLNHLVSMETSFNDLLAKYIKSKNTIKDLQHEEKLYQNKTSKYELVIEQYQNMYLNLKQITYDALNTFNDKWADTLKNHTAEVTKLNAIIKKHDVTIASLQESIIQKTRDNEEFTAICDDLIIKLH